MNKKQSQSGSAHLVIIIVLVVALLGALGYIFYLNFMQPKATPTVAETPAPVVVAQTLPTAETVENIKAAISSGNTAALSGYMADTVAVICIPCGFTAGPGQTPTWDQTKDQAILTVTNKCSQAEGTWNFNLGQATIASYSNANTFFGDSVKSNSIIGKTSISGDMILLNFDTAGKINMVITTQENLLI